MFSTEFAGGGAVQYINVVNLFGSSCGPLGSRLYVVVVVVVVVVLITLTL